MAHPDDSEALAADESIARSLRRTWGAFFLRFGRLTKVQREAIPTLLDGQNVLLCSATASGKTEAACAPLLERRLGVRHSWTILYISPTRALVNDLYERLRVPCTALSIRVVRRTGEHRGALDPLPQVLITTPESFDSLLCRGGSGGRHVLGNVDAVVLDEIHLLHGTARGEQLRWLLERLRKVRLVMGESLGRASTPLQIVALSATVPDADGVRDGFLPGGSIIRVLGSRKIERVGLDGSGADVESALPAYIRSLIPPEKILVFGNSRRRVDDLAGTLSSLLRDTEYRVLAHHGSLSQEVREETESLLKRLERVVVVATSTLEIGVDIGDIDLVVLDGPAPDIPSLLQRIGRGNRRSGRTRLMACANSAVESLVQAAMLDAAEDGWLGDQHRGPHPSVIRQQTASYIFQSDRRERSRHRLESLITTMGVQETAKRILRQMLEKEELVEGPQGIRLSGPWLEKVDRGEIHSTIEDTRGAAVVDADTGRQIATGVEFLGGEGIGVGGNFLRIRDWSEWKLLVRREGGDAGDRGHWRYPGRPWLLGPGQGQAVRRYLQLDPLSWPAVQTRLGTVILHFGGGRRQAFLDLLRESSDRFQVTDWLIQCQDDPSEVRSRLASRASQSIRARLSSRLDVVERRLGISQQNRTLPQEVREDTAFTWLGVAAETAALLNSRWQVEQDAETRKILSWFGTALVVGM